MTCPPMSTPISTCNDVATTSDSASSPAEIGGQSVRLRADPPGARPGAAFGQLAGNVLNDRSVKLKYRRAGSDDGWTVLWMRAPGHRRRLRADHRAAGPAEFQATFPAPSDEGLRFSESDLVKVKVNK